MPMTRISLLKGKPPAYLQALSDSLDRALVEAFEVPPNDRFQLIHQHEANELIFDRHYMGGPRSDDFTVFAISAGRPRSDATRAAFFRRLVELLAEAPGMRPEDVMVSITTSESNEWSLGGGNAGILAPPGAPR
ncbi:phenylpyruvate tautomerase PptA (4-oxalocrotonate tautomerase family) [Janthinobacterium sp. CG_23.3]|uniref:tautomerase family protein n=1 Tax=Janthinobacterium sp. CG_23.3 TaxID=3349634 RepID=UPI0038D4592F